jgi:putative transposase
MSDTRVVRALPLDLRANAGKQDVLRTIHQLGVRCVRDNLHTLRRTIQDNGDVPKHLNTTAMLNTHGMPARYRAELAPNAVGPTQSWRSHVINDSKSSLRGSSIPKKTDFYRAVYRLITFGYGLGNTKLPKPSIQDKLTLTTEEWSAAYALCRSITRHQVSRRRFPTIRHDASLTLGGKVVTIDAGATLSFDAVVTFMGLTRGNPIHVPVDFPEHTHRRIDQGFAAVNAVQLAPEPGGVRLRVVAARSPIERVLTGKVVGIDVGAAAPVTTSDGDIFGQEFWRRVQHYDRVLQRAMNGIQLRDGRRHWKDSATCRNATRRLRNYVRNEINRVLNRLVEIHDPDELVVEKLDKCFNPDTGLSPRMRRLLRSVGRAAFRAKVSALSEERSITVTEVNPAYTSKGCHCGNVDDRNRPRRDLFSCTRCKRKRSADVHAATMILGRRSVPGLSRDASSSSHIGGRRAALAHQLALTQAWCGERNIQPDSSAGAGRELRVPDKPSKAA